jgi:excisionase family DNA binding protein
MDETRETEHPVPDVEKPEEYASTPYAQGQRLVPDLHHERYRVQEVANLLGMSVDVIRHAVQRGDLKAEHVEHEITFIHRDDLLAWLNRRGPGL